MFAEFMVVVAAGALDAPVTAVTVFADQARVTRTAQLNVAASPTLEWPVLPDSVDVASIRVEASGAEVRRVDIDRVTPGEFRTADAKALIAELDALELEQARVRGEVKALSEQRGVLEKLVPAEAPLDATHPLPKLNASSWPAVFQFANDQRAKVEQRLRDREAQDRQLTEARSRAAAKARALGNPETASGWRVSAQVAGPAVATVTLTYVARNARWAPTWDLQLQPATNVVTLALAGVVSQATGEDWANASLVLSTALPSNAVTMPKLPTWKIGTTERFIPAPQPRADVVAPPPAAPKVSDGSGAEQPEVRRRLLALIGAAPAEAKPAAPSGSPNAPGVVMGTVTDKNTGRGVPDVVVSATSAGRTEQTVITDAAGSYRMVGLPKSPWRLAFEREGYRTYNREGVVVRDERAVRVDARLVPERVSAESITVSTGSSFSFNSTELSEPVRETASFNLAAPGGWQPPSSGADSPIALAGGYDLTFASLQKETIASGQGARRVPLWSARWPVTVERTVFPAVSADTYLVAQLKNPSTQVLPGGPAHLFVGADPAGAASLKLVSPGEPFTLPLGIDRAVTSVRNVQVVDSTQGVFSKDEVSTYTVTIEVVNPYSAPIALRVADQWPLSNTPDVEVKLLDSKPGASADSRTGHLEWRFSLAAKETKRLSFTYSLKRPQGSRLFQSETP